MFNTYNTWVFASLSHCSGFVNILNMFLRLLDEVVTNISNLFSKNISNDLAFLLIKPNEPKKDKFLNMYRQYEFNEKSPLHENHYVEKYKDCKLDREKYKLFISHMKVSIFCIFKQVYRVLSSQKIISQDKEKDLLAELLNYLKKSEHTAPKLIDNYQKFKAFDEYCEIINKECFDGKLTNESLMQMFDDFSIMREGLISKLILK